MSPNEYQQAAHTFAGYGNNVMYPALGLAEEAGEAAGKLAKFIRKNDGCAPMICAEHLLDQQSTEWCAANKQFRQDLAAELGDVCWMVAELATVYDLKLEDILKKNIDKLTDRKARGVIVGSGDNR